MSPRNIQEENEAFYLNDIKPEHIYLDMSVSFETAEC